MFICMDWSETKKGKKCPNPKETLLLLLNVTAVRLFEVVPAETLILVTPTLTEPVIVEPFSPNETPLPLPNVSAEKLFDVVPAERLNA